MPYWDSSGLQGSHKESAVIRESRNLQYLQCSVGGIYKFNTAQFDQVGAAVEAIQIQTEEEDLSKKKWTEDITRF